MPVWMLLAFMVGTDITGDHDPALVASGPNTGVGACSNGITRAGVGVAQTRALLGVSINLELEAESVFGVRPPLSRLLPPLKLPQLPAMPSVPRLGLRVREGGVTLKVGALTLGFSLRLEVGTLFSLLESAVGNLALKCVERPSVALMPWKTALNVAMADPNLPDLRVDLMASLNLLVRIRQANGSSADPGSALMASYFPWVGGDGWGTRNPGSAAPSQTRNVFTPFTGSRPTQGFVGTQLAPPQWSTPPTLQSRQSGAPTAFQPSFTSGM